MINNRVNIHVKRIILWLSLLSCLLFAGCAMINYFMSETEIPQYTVLETKDDIEVRLYKPINIASVTVAGKRKEALSQGFRVLADYIFGNNQIKQAINMTAPVQQQSADQISQKIAMTAPVAQQMQDDMWQISFVMPSQYSIDSLPMPNNKQVTLIAIPQQKVATIQFSGVNTDDNIAKHEKLLMQYLKQQGISSEVAPKYAFYNSPWTLPFMRRNEVHIQLFDK